MLTYISLFSGVGGFDLGFDRAGMACLAQVEFNPKASDVLAYHWPNVKRFKDVRDVGKHNLPTPDVLCGGFPCQDVSVAGKRSGLAGERSGLWFEYLRIVQELKPRFVVIENVPGLLSSNKGADFAVILRGLAECGYCVAYRILDSKYFGVAQRRRRVFIVASLGNGSCAQILFEPAGSTRDTEPSREAGKRVAINFIEGTKSYRFRGFGDYTPYTQSSPLKARDHKDATDLVAFNVTFCDANGKRKDCLNDGLYVNETDKSNTLTQGAIDHTLVTQPFVGTLPASGAGTARTGNERSEASLLVPVAKAVDVRSLAMGSEVSGTLQAKKSGGWSLNYINPIAFNWQNSSLRSMAVDTTSPTLETDKVPATAHIAYGIRTDITPKWLENTAPTLLTPSKSGGGHPPEVVTPTFAVRRLTPTECERLQGFPDSWTTQVNTSDSATYTQMGNAVTVNVAEWIGQLIVAVEWSRLFGLEAQS